MLQYVQDVRVVRGMGRGFSDHHVVLCKVRLVGAWIKRREVLVGARRIRSGKLRKHQYKGYAMSLEGKGIDLFPIKATHVITSEDSQLEELRLS